MVIRVSPTAYSAIWGIIGIALGAGWVLYGVLASDSKIFLAVMLVASIVLGGGAALLLERNDRPR